MNSYIDKTLQEKLGIKPNMKICLLNIPDNYLELTGELHNEIDLELKSKYDLIHFFTKDRLNLVKHIKLLKDSLNVRGIVWISWPKKSSKVPSDMTEQAVRDFALPIGLVDIKVCAIDNIWSGLKLVRRVNT